MPVDPALDAEIKRRGLAATGGPPLHLRCRPRAGSLAAESR